MTLLIILLSSIQKQFAYTFTILSHYVQSSVLYTCYDKSFRQ